MKILFNHYRLAMLVIFCLTLSIGRIFITDTFMYLFLVWNLFLAGIPWLISEVIKTNKFRRLPMFLMIMLCVLFLPNSPYMITDLFHLGNHRSTIIWYDTLLISTYAWTGILFFYFSLNNLGEVLKRSYNVRWLWPYKFILIFSSAFGIYIGRFLRFNSWDVISQPYPLVRQLADRVLNPQDHPLAWGMTLAYGAFLALGYLVFNARKAEVVN